MWYSNTDKRKLDMAQPIIATIRDEPYLLLPQIETESFNIIGYNWFNIKKGEYNSCAVYKTVEKAIELYSTYSIKNAEIIIKQK